MKSHESYAEWIPDAQINQNYNTPRVQCVPRGLSSEQIKMNHYFTQQMLRDGRKKSLANKFSINF